MSNAELRRLYVAAASAIDLPGKMSPAQTAALRQLLLLASVAVDDVEASRLLAWAADGPGYLTGDDVEGADLIATLLSAAAELAIVAAAF